ncbi:hypothetical protein M378DRAFT_168678 [Amanita muscaria Koide BX008]|uniref:Uncharacterized protein n=1 Tax=Amanita muscaria (strain Koide BX008) TaxID=946122 RepID=A0A0C2T0G1_AMAMK|nr:hypothetical protein M378DRAFT_168678 [Amanita muscaria Koide BX008]
MDTGLPLAIGNVDDPGCVLGECQTLPPTIVNTATLTVRRHMIRTTPGIEPELLVLGSGFDWSTVTKSR